MIDRAVAEISFVLFVGAVALVTIPVPRHKPPVPVEVPAQPAPVAPPVVVMPGSADVPAESEEGGVPLQVERKEEQVTIKQLLVKLNRIEKKINEAQDNADADRHTN